MQHKKTKKILLSITMICTVVLSIFGCSSNLGINTKKDKQVLFVYLCGSSLETKYSAATKNIAQMLEAKLPERTRVILQTGGAKKWRNYNIPSDKNCRYEIINGRLTLIEENTSANMGLDSTLSDFLLWGSEKYSADEYSLILWDHGGGSIKGVCNDEIFGNDALSLPELDVALSSFQTTVKKKLSFLGFDACLMATYDTAQLASKYANHMIASEELEPTGGWDYTALLENLGKKDFFQNVLQTYAKKHDDKQYYTLSHIDLSKFSSIEKTLQKVVEAFEKDDTSHTAIVALKNALNFGSNTNTAGYANLYDLGNLANYFDIDYNLDNCIETINGELRNTATGISLYFPNNNTETLSQYYSLSANERYNSYLQNFFEDIGKQTIAFKNYGEIFNNYLRFELEAKSMEKIKSIEYELLQLITEEEYKTTVFGLGRDNDIEIHDNSVSIAFEGRWIELAGKNKEGNQTKSLLNCSIQSSDGKNTIYASPININGERGNLLFSYVIADKTTKIIGYTLEADGYSKVQSFVEKDLIEILYENPDANIEGKFINGETVLYTDGITPAVINLPDGFYQYHAIVQDIYGSSFYSSTAVVEIKNGNSTLLFISDDVVHQ